jgi:hypothetical protein
MVCPSQPLNLVTAIPLKRNPKIGKMKEFDKMALLGQLKKEPEYRFRKLGKKHLSFLPNPKNSKMHHHYTVQIFSNFLFL